MLKHIIVSQWQWARPPAQPVTGQSNNLYPPLRQAGWASLMLITLAVCLATAGGFFGRLGGLLELSSHFRWQYCLVLLLITVLFSLGHKRRQALVAGLFGTVNLALIVPFYVPVTSPPAPAPTHRALMLNLLYANDDYGSVKRFIETANPDFFVLVEFTDAWEEALQPFATSYPYVSQAPGRGETVLYSRVPFAAINTPIAEYKSRPPVVVTLDMAGQPITLIGAHPNAPRSASRVALRNRQLAAMARVAAGQPGPVLLLGDLNITPWSPFFHDFLAASGLRNGRQGFGIQPSWPAQRSLLGIPIDHALASPDITIHNFETGPYVGSDHYPIIVDFSIHPQSQLAQR